MRLIDPRRVGVMAVLSVKVNGSALKLATVLKKNRRKFVEAVRKTVKDE
jgi:hypothetical protein